ncbi:MAG: VOC family protein [Rhodospirillaceae bacterium]|nr:VOC family protein [Rhodospirillaceae bacterium]
MPDNASMFDRSIPILASSDIAASLDYFNKLGFETHNFGDSYGIAVREHIEIHFWLCTDKNVAENTSCYVRVNDIHALRADLARRADVGEVVETSWGMDELYVWDPTGSLVKFGQVTERMILADTVQEASPD